MKFDNISEFESTTWKKEMAQFGETMQQRNVRKVIFVHGTFAGDDPLGIFEVMKSLGMPAVATDAFKDLAKKITDKRMDDLGNFPADYISSFGNGVGLDFDQNCIGYTWNSQNNHIGRLLAVPELAEKIVEKAKGFSSDDRILLLGHSHAGQLFALLTIFLEDGEKANALFSVLAEEKVDAFDKRSFSENIKKISNINMDIVTLGAPVRYPWGEFEKYRLLNIVNHRSDSKLSGVLTTRDGDYVQQWGTDGTDLPSSNPVLKGCNDKLDSILDKGRSIDFGAKLEEIKRRQPIKVNGEEAGKTIFVDYLDNGSNAIETFFGHGVYTRRYSMLFNTRLIVDDFYS